MSILADLNLAFQYLKDATKKGQFQGEHVFLVRAYSLWKASLRIGLSEQVPECYPLLRASLETAVYCHHIFTQVDNKSLLIWLDRRDETGKVRKTFFQTFQFSSLVKGIKDESVRECAKSLYESSIEFGAHPNYRAVLHGLSDTGRGAECKYLGADQNSRQFSIMHLLFTGLCVLQVFAELLPEVSENLSLRDYLRDIEVKCLAQSHEVFPELKRERERVLEEVRKLHGQPDKTKDDNE